MDSNDAWNGTSPTGATPWLRATFTDEPNHTVELTLTALHLSTNKGNVEDVQDWLFNVDPSLTPSDLKFSFVSKVGTFTNPTINETTQNGQKTQANVPFDIDFAFATGKPADRFSQGDSITYTVTDTKDPTFDAAAFKFTTSSNGSGPNPLYDSAHIQNTGSNGNGSGDIATINVSVPEPFSRVSCIGSFLTGLGLFIGTRNRRVSRSTK